MNTLSKIQSLTNIQLHDETQAAARTEKSATLALLEHLAEVDRRRLYAEMAYGSLWEYVHKALGYSEAQASERVSSIRLMQRVPQVRESLERGELSLTTTAKLASHVRREALAPHEALELLGEVAGKSSREVERVLVSHAQAPARPERVRAITPTLTRVSFDADDEFMRLVERARELGGYPGSSVQEMLAAALREYVKKREVTAAGKVRTENVRRESSADLPAQELRAPEVRPAAPEEKGEVSAKGSAEPIASATRVRTRYISAAARRLIRRRSGGRCEFVDPRTQRRCEARHRLQLDHIRPHAKGGTREAWNLRQLCAEHNRLAAIRAFGAEKMKRWMR